MGQLATEQTDLWSQAAAACYSMEDILLRRGREENSVQVRWKAQSHVTE